MKQQYCVFNTKEKAERVICGLPLSYRLRWRSYDEVKAKEKELGRYLKMAERMEISKKYGL